VALENMMQQCRSGIGKSGKHQRSSVNGSSLNAYGGISMAKTASAASGVKYHLHDNHHAAS